MSIQPLTHAAAARAGGAGGAGSGLAPCASPQHWAALADGAYVFTVVGTDRVGNAAPPVAAAFVVDSVPPAIGDLAAPAATRDGNFSAAFAVSDAGSGVARVQCRRAPRRRLCVMRACRTELRDACGSPLAHATTLLTAAGSCADTASRVA